MSQQQQQQEQLAAMAQLAAILAPNRPVVAVAAPWGGAPAAAAPAIGPASAPLFYRGGATPAPQPFAAAVAASAAAAPQVSAFANLVLASSGRSFAAAPSHGSLVADRSFGGGLVRAGASGWGGAAAVPAPATMAAPSPDDTIGDMIRAVAAAKEIAIRRVALQAAIINTAAAAATTNAVAAPTPLLPPFPAVTTVPSVVETSRTADVVVPPAEPAEKPAGTKKEIASRPSTPKKKIKAAARSKAAAAPRDPHQVDKPKRPLSAYNYFFQHERVRLLALADRGERLEDHPPVNLNVTDVRRVLKAAAGAKTDDPVEHKDKATTKKANHGKVGFADLIKHMSAAWRNVHPETRAIFQDISEGDKARYRQEMRAYRVKVNAVKSQTKRKRDADDANVSDKATNAKPKYATLEEKLRAEKKAKMEADASGGSDTGGKPKYATLEEKLRAEKKAKTEAAGAKG